MYAPSPYWLIHMRGGGLWSLSRDRPCPENGYSSHLGTEICPHLCTVWILLYGTTATMDQSRGNPPDEIGSYYITHLVFSVLSKMYSESQLSPHGIPRCYMAQIQGQLGVCELPWCDFMPVCTKTREIILKRVYFSQLYWKHAAEKLKTFCTVLQVRLYPRFRLFHTERVSWSSQVQYIWMVPRQWWHVSCWGAVWIDIVWMRYLVVLWNIIWLPFDISKHATEKLKTFCTVLQVHFNPSFGLIHTEHVSPSREM